VHMTFEAELRANVAECRVRGLVPWCTSELGPPTLGLARVIQTIAACVSGVCQV
jgi:hypothetical protein